MLEKVLKKGNRYLIFNPYLIIIFVKRFTNIIIMPNNSFKEVRDKNSQKSDIAVVNLTDN